MPTFPGDIWEHTSDTLDDLAIDLEEHDDEG